MSEIQTQPSDLVDITATVLAGLSLIGAFFIFMSYVVHPRLRTFSFRIFLWMAIFDAMVALMSIFGPLGLLKEQGKNHLSWKCRMQAVVLNFGMFGSHLWNLCFGFHLIRLVNKLFIQKKKKKKEKCKLCLYITISLYYKKRQGSFVLYTLFTILTSGVLTMLMSIINIDGNALQDKKMYLAGVNTDFWCWIDNSALLDNHKYQMVFITFLIANCTLLLIYICMRRQLKHLQSVPLPLNHHYLLHNRRVFLRTIAGGYSAYLAAPFVAYAPANFNWLCTRFSFVFHLFIICYTYNKL
ncbi:hypothetical protein RFI_08968 [Reticulomyxa filosa]|uniref:Uncharacterized protein n=1 Tax=Reticulomyxa filosa TaxID=46433 RepID=X6NPF0_RETFI|nr:hypothetical protein RFI_08968 [Reticulomyxa filosa]|eukprot:ETO28165.1 hypothetical protein RFI_08968 [Reticulomyxa filosa]